MLTMSNYYARTVVVCFLFCEFKVLALSNNPNQGDNSLSKLKEEKINWQTDSKTIFFHKDHTTDGEKIAKVYGKRYASILKIKIGYDMILFKPLEL